MSGDNLNSTPSIDFSECKEDRNVEKTILPSNQELNINEKRQALENLKRELLEEKETIESIQVDEEPTLSKRKK